MPFEIVRNDILNMKVDAIVNTANPKPVVGYGLDEKLHEKAGSRVLEERKAIGNIDVGRAAITSAGQLSAKYVIHTVSPWWQGGTHMEELRLASCYRHALFLAIAHKCESIAFPLLATGNMGLPKKLSLKIAVEECRRFLKWSDIQIYLVVHDEESFEISEELYAPIKSYIDDNLIDPDVEDTFVEPCLNMSLDVSGIEIQEESKQEESKKRQGGSGLGLSAENTLCFQIDSDEEKRYLMNRNVPLMTLVTGYGLDKLDAGFSETLLYIIERGGRKESDVYRKANVSRQHFSKIRKNIDYVPSKRTAVAFAIALELNLKDTQDLLSRAGYILSNSSKFDVIIKWFIKERRYDIFEINEVLFKFDQPLLGV